MFGFFKKPAEDRAPDDTESRLRFSKRLQAVTNKIHATGNLDELMLELPKEICDLFHCDRMTLYAVSRDRKTIFSKVKTGIHTNKDLILPIDTDSIAGYVALSERMLRIRDVYDAGELKTYSAELKFCRAVDQITGYRTKQMLAAPIFNPNSQALVGVIQLLNNRDDGAFTETAAQGLKELCETLAVAFAQRMKATASALSKYQPLIVEAVISQAELELAINWARRKNIDIEDALIDEFQVPQSALGQALGKTHKLPYEPFQADRKIPVDLLQKIDRRFAESQQCVPIEGAGANLVFLTTDPEHAADSAAMREAFPYHNLFYRVTTKREFRQTLDRFFGDGQFM